MRRRSSTAPTIAVATVPTLVGVAINLATDLRTNLWAWAGVVVLAVLSVVVALWAASRQQTTGAENRQETAGTVVGGRLSQVRRVGGRVTVRNARRPEPGPPAEPGPAGATPGRAQPDAGQAIRDSHVSGSAAQISDVEGDVEID